MLGVVSWDKKIGCFPGPPLMYNKWLSKQKFFLCNARYVWWTPAKTCSDRIFFFFNKWRLLSGYNCCFGHKCRNIERGNKDLANLQSQSSKTVVLHAHALHVVFSFLHILLPFSSYPQDFTRQMTWNNAEVIAETQSFIYRWRSSLRQLPIVYVAKLLED